MNGLKICKIGDCREYAGSPHHDPPRSLLDKADWDNPLYHKDMCPRHHRLRHDIGLTAFQKQYPNYKVVTIEQYRRTKREILCGSNPTTDHHSRPHP